MKKYYLFMGNLIAIAFFCTIFTACSDDYGNLSSFNDDSNLPCKKLTQVITTHDFWNSLDSISYVHSSNRYVIKNIYSRANDRGTVSKKEMAVVKKENLIGGKIADQLGSIAGKYGGKWIGGKLFKDPFSKKMGKRVGQAVGSLAGGILASTLANIFIPVYSTTPTLPSGSISTRPVTPINGTIGLVPNKTTTLADSIGYIHNKIMNKLTSNRKKYFKSNNTINYDLLYTDCVTLLKQEDIYNDTISYDLGYRKNILDFAKETANYSISCYNGEISGNTVLDKGIVLLKKNYNICDEEAQEIEHLSTTITNTANGMSREQAQSYLNDINLLIRKEGLTTTQQEAFTSYATLSISSSQLWDHNKKD